MKDITTKGTLLQGCDKDTKIRHVLAVVNELNPFSNDTIQKLAFRLQMQPSVLASKVEKVRKEGVIYAK